MGKTALVTGGSEGIGRAFAERLAKEGYTVTVVARNESKLKDLVSKLGSNHQYLASDLSTAQGQALLMEKISIGKFDLLVNNAGVGTLGNFIDVPLDKQLAMFHLNCEALLKLSHTYLKNSKAGDALINVSSALAFMPTPKMALYSATKAFVTAFTDALWFEEKSRGVYVMGLCPGITETNFQINAGGRKEDLPKGLSETPEMVVSAAIRALNNRRAPTVVSGNKNRIFSSLPRFLSRQAVVNMAGKMVP